MYVKRSQKDYSMSFKLDIVREVESGERSTTSANRKYDTHRRSIVVNRLRKHGAFGLENQTLSTMQKSQE